MMLAVISPAKTLDFETPLPFDVRTKPKFLKDAYNLARKLRDLNASQLSKLMNISPKLGELNYKRYQEWEAPSKFQRARPAIFAFKGDVYTGFDVDSMARKDLDFAQKMLRMLSGIYGVLRPFDLMQAYRLEMGTSFATEKGKNLYAYWGDRITQSLNDDLKSERESTLINLASQEYFNAVRPALLKARVITPLFKEWRDGKLKIISFNAKRARGMMSHYIVKKRIKDPEELKQFDRDGYHYDAERTQSDEWLFVR